ncbi:baseplate J/gp47 family protein [Solimonas soli]|uniref:baseplate J/gp47 family protein n=1 Tax=Solimonas soli TaxID=413479 RepID=UPI000488BE89|nr:baseplate J/gp47 family protein [Solimonas soli]
MPIELPSLDDRRYQQLVDETLARVPVHTPEWTNFNKSDPGVTLVELFSFLTESLLYRANQIPERNRRKFLQLLGLGLRPAEAARGLVTISNERGDCAAVTVPAGLEVRAGSLPFRVELGLDVLPVEARAYFKRQVAAAGALLDYTNLLYASYSQDLPGDFDLYESVAFDGKLVPQLDLNADTVDGTLWIALLARKGDSLDDARAALAARTLTLGIVPALDAERADLTPGGRSDSAARGLLEFALPKIPADGGLPLDAQNRPAPSYRVLEPRTDVDLLAAPGVVQLTLPAAGDLQLWNDLDPLEAGVGDLPPALTDASVAGRVVTWLRIKAGGAAKARLLWAGINAAPVVQRERVAGERLAAGNGTPDQQRRLARAPVLPGSVSVLSVENGTTHVWQEIDDLAAAGAEVPLAAVRLPPGAPQPPPAPSEVFIADHEAGLLTFGDGLRGRRLPDGAPLLASYECCAGAAGNVGAASIAGAPALPSGFSVTNPVRTWGGADAQSVADGEKQIRRWLQHRDRLVSADDFEPIARRAPGVDLGRIDVLPAFHPDLVPGEPGSAPGVVTVMAIPRVDPRQPDAPQPDRLFLDALCRHLDARRLVTTELVVRGPVYKPLWISVGIDAVAGVSVAETVDAVKARLREFLRPVREADADTTLRLFAPQQASAAQGWPLRTAVTQRVLMAEVARVAGVAAVVDLLLASGGGAASASIDMVGLELPRVLGISVVAGDPLSIEALRGDASAASASSGRPRLPVPVTPENC